MELDLGELIRAWRKSNGIPQHELARTVGVSQSCVARWEMGEHRPEYDRLPLIAAAVGAETMSRFFSGPPVEGAA